MFSGIVETTGKVVNIEKEGTNIHFTIETHLAKELKIDQSLSHDGVCLTIVNVNPTYNQYVVTAIEETLNRTNLKTWTVGYEVNLERSVQVGGRFDGHIVLGHVDQTAICTKIEEFDGSWKFYFKYDNEKNNITVEKGSICVNGVSLTVVDSEKGMFSVAIIPHTYKVTNFHNIKVGTIVNIEFDIVGKYIAALLKEYLKS